MNASSPVPLQGAMLGLAAFLLALANFIVVLDMTVTNVAISSIAGGLGASASQGIYVITAYAVAEAITVPMTGWLVTRIGAVRLFGWAMLVFGVSSILCGLAQSLEQLVAMRILQGLAGGPLMPLSQTLLLRIFPRQQSAIAIAIWSLTTMAAPIVGPVVGGMISDNWGWNLIFFINIPIALACWLLPPKLISGFENCPQIHRFDTVGFILLIIWVGALQLMLDEGKNLDWFESRQIIGLAITATVGFILFLIWEWYEPFPVVNLRVFRHRGYSIGVLSLSLAFGTFFGTIVLTPLWLQHNMGYTATDAGVAMSIAGILSFFVAPAAAALSEKKDPRLLVCIGVLLLAAVMTYRSFGNNDMAFSDISWPLLIQGIGLPLFFIPLTMLAISSVEPDEVASAAGQMTFLRAISGAFATSIVTTYWDDAAREQRVELAAMVQPPPEVLASTENFQLFNWLVDGQSVMLATNRVLLYSAVAFLLAAILVWLAPRPNRVVDLAEVH